jgi:hypothetical protein
MPAAPAGTRSFPLDHVREIGLDKFKAAIPTRALDPVRLEFLQERFLELKERGAHGLSAKQKAFKNRMSVRVGGEDVLLECLPNREAYPYAATIEFNPNPFLRRGQKAIDNLAHFFRFLFGHDAPQILSQAIVTMLHVNVDFDINVLEGTLVAAKGKRGGANVMCNFDGDGTLGTLYVGVLGSDRRLCIYDKATEVLHRELGPHANKVLAALASDKWDIEIGKLREKLAGPPRWRMEVRCQPKGGRPVSELTEFASCFEGILLLHLPPERAPFNTALGRSFVRNALHDGIPAALQLLGELDRRRFNRAISKQDDVEWFNAELLYDCIRTVIDKLAPVFRTRKRILVPGAGAHVTTRPLPVRQPAKSEVSQSQTRKHRVG